MVRIVIALALIPKKTEKRVALMWQLKFRKTILQQKYKDKTVFNFSRKSASGKYVQLTVDALSANLQTLLAEALKGPCTEKRRPTTPLLVGKRIKHWFSDRISTGRVVSVVPGYPDWYNAVYKSDPAVYTYRLLDDYRKGDVKILPEVYFKVDTGSTEQHSFSEARHSTYTVSLTTNKRPIIYVFDFA
jgi:hypothetical protein